MASFQKFMWSYPKVLNLTIIGTRFWCGALSFYWQRHYQFPCLVLACDAGLCRLSHNQLRLIAARPMSTVDNKKSQVPRYFIKARTYLKPFRPQYLRYYFAAKLNASIWRHWFKFCKIHPAAVNSDVVGKVVTSPAKQPAFIWQKFRWQLASEISEPEMIQSFISARDETIASALWKPWIRKAIREIIALLPCGQYHIAISSPLGLGRKTKQRCPKVREVCYRGRWTCSVS